MIINPQTVGFNSFNCVLQKLLIYIYNIIIISYELVMNCQ